MAVQTIGRYEIEREIGHGGMSVVYLARDPRVKRAVAVKILPRQFTHEPQFRARFQREAELIATLEHPFIVTLYDFGEEEDQPFIVMRYMPGGTLQQRLAANGPLALPELAHLATRLAEALDEAHAQNIIHRDLKPGNILFDARGEGYLSDFGIAKISEATAFTGTGIIGTPEYMSPEQARGIKDLDGRSDVYALGSVVFQALTGHLPYKASTPMGAAVAHITEPVPNILTVKSDLPPACAAIMQCALAKNPDDRYPTAGQFAHDLTRLASGQSVAPPRPSAARAPAKHPLPPPAFTDPITIAPEHVKEIAQLRTLSGHTGPVTSVAFSPDGHTLVSGSLDKTVCVWEINFGQVLHVLRHHTDGIWCVAYSPDGRTVASGGRDSTVYLWNIVTGFPRHTLKLKSGVTSLAFSPDGRTLVTGSHDSSVQLWDTDTGALQRTWMGHTGRVTSVAFSPDGKSVASSGVDGTVRFWTTSGGTNQLRSTPFGQATYLWSIAFSPDGQWLAGAADKTIRLWNLNTNLQARVFEGHTSAVSSVAFSPDGRTLASGDANKLVQLWETNTGKSLRTLTGHTEEVHCVAFSPGGRLLASASAGGTIRLWGVKDAPPTQ